jgi:monothiol glutaredoxin
MSERKIFDPNQATPEVLAKMASFHRDVVDEVEAAIHKHDVVVVGMAQNPFVRKVRAALKEADVAFEYLEYGSYLSEWKKRLAIKLWTGWSTFPQVFVKGTFVGGHDLVQAALADGSLKKKLAG